MHDQRRALGTSAWAAAAVLALISGCGSCSSSGGADPRAHIPASAETVIELSDVAKLPETRALVEARLSKIIPAEDIVQAQAELQRMLGFDPLTKEGLEAAGLATSGRVAGSVTETSGLWVIPISDAEKVKKTVIRLAEGRYSVDASEETVEGVKMTVFGRSFGEETAVVAAYATKGKLAFIGAGSDAKKTVTEAMGLDPKASILESASYAGIGEELGEGWLLRAIMPQLGASVRGQLKAAASKGKLAVDDEALSDVKGAAWSLGLTSAGLQLKGRLQIADETLAKMKEAFGAKKGLSDGIRSVDVSGSALLAYANGDAKKLLDRLAPQGSKARRRLRHMLMSAGYQSEDQIIDQLTGQLGFTMGVGDLSKVDLRQLMGNPMSAMWTVIALGSDAPEKLAALDEEMQARLSERGFSVEEREVKDMKITSVVSSQNPEQLLVQSFARPGAVVFANESAVTEAILSISPGIDPLKGEPGIYAELRLAKLAGQLRAFDMSQIPLMFRSLVDRGLDGLSVFDELSVSVRPAEDGVALDGLLTLAPLPDEQ